MSHTAEDLGLLATEASDPRFANLDTLSVAELAILMNTADHTVSYAVAAAFTTIVPALEAASQRMAGGGGRIYVGGGAGGRRGGVGPPWRGCRLNHRIPSSESPPVAAPRLLWPRLHAPGAAVRSPSGSRAILTPSSATLPSTALRSTSDRRYLRAQPA